MTVPLDPLRAGAVLEVLEQLAAERIPYIWGGKALPPGLDCSGAVCYALEQARLAPYGFGREHNAASLYDLCAPLTAQQAQPGDLVFYGHAHVSHVMMVAPGDRVVGASGGDRRCASVEVAHQLGACVQYRPLRTYRPADVAGYGRLPQLVALAA